MKRKEYVVWGCVGGQAEQPLFTTVLGKPITSKEVAVRLLDYAERKGATSVRIQTVDFDDDLGFERALQRGSAN